MKAIRIWGLAATVFAASCAVGPDYETPRPDVKSRWGSLEEYTEGQSSVARASSEDVSQWWLSLKDSELDRLIERALAANLDLRQAASRVREARGLRGIAQGALLPEVEATGSYQRQRWATNGLYPSEGKPFNYYQAGFDASWEIDVFGGSRRGLEAAQADLEASAEALRDVRVSVLAEVARLYVDLRGLQARIAISRQNLEAQKKTADLTRAKLDAGQTTELDVDRAEAQVSATASVIPGLEASARQSIHAIAVLLGQEPGALVVELSQVAAIPAAPREIPVGLPTDLLRRRPDLRRAERELAASTARIGVAEADLYPRFFLSGAYGWNSISSTDFFTLAANRAWSFGPSIQWSLFQGGRIRANIEVQNARQEQAALRFEQTLLGALRDVEDALVAHAREQHRRVLLAKAVTLQEKAVEIAKERYTQGLVDFLTVLEAQRFLYGAQDTLAQSEQAVATHTVALYKAVGGGWKPEPEEASRP
jgi:NodT family efflux transporter outer membrane factor (OMF) lipoprotein